MHLFPLFRSNKLQVYVFHLLERLKEIHDKVDGLDRVERLLGKAEHPIVVHIGRK